MNHGSAPPASAPSRLPIPYAHSLDDGLPFEPPASLQPTTWSL